MAVTPIRLFAEVLQVELLQVNDNAFPNNVKPLAV